MFITLLKKKKFNFILLSKTFIESTRKGISCKGKIKDIFLQADIGFS